MLAEQVAAAARMLARMEYVHAFGHVSARDGDHVWFTPTWPPLGRLTPERVLLLDLEGNVVRGEQRYRPIEVDLHLGLYRHRPEVGAMCRIHGLGITVWAARRRVPPVLHGFGGIAGKVAFWDDPDLFHSRQMGEEVAAAVGHADAVLMSGNGAIVLGSDLPQAMVRAWSLEERCRLALYAGPEGVPFSPDELQRRSRWYGGEEKRLWVWLRARYGDPEGEYAWAEGPQF